MWSFRLSEDAGDNARCGKRLTWDAVFEGSRHPFRKNFIHVDGKLLGTKIRVRTTTGVEGYAEPRVSTVAVNQAQTA